MGWWRKTSGVLESVSFWCGAFGSGFDRGFQGICHLILFLLFHSFFWISLRVLGLWAHRQITILFAFEAPLLDGGSTRIAASSYYDFCVICLKFFHPVRFKWKQKLDQAGQLWLEASLPLVSQVSESKMIDDYPWWFVWWFICYRNIHYHHNVWWVSKNSRENFPRSTRRERQFVEVSDAALVAILVAAPPGAIQQLDRHTAHTTSVSVVKEAKWSMIEEGTKLADVSWRSICILFFSKKHMMTTIGLDGSQPC